jgi:hypothetical protein
MKIGLIKLGESLSFNSQSAVGLVSGEPLVLVKILIEHGNHIGLGSIRPKGKDFARPTDLDENLLSFFDLTTRKETDKLNEWADILIVWGGYINFWGGAENSSIMHQYELINKFDGKVFYINTDAIIILEQLIPYIDRKDWAQKYDFADLNITRKDITVITQSMNTELVKSKIEAGGVPVGSIVYKDLWKLPAFNKVQEINQ